MQVSNTQKQRLLLVGLLLILLSACSTRKSTFLSRAYHNTTTHYNWYFNGKENIKASVKKLEAKHEEDYNEIIPIYPLGSEKDAQSVVPKMDKAIKKGATAISRHSILLKGEEHNRWVDDCYLMIAQAYFYQREYVKSIEAFRHISRQFRGSYVDYEARVWLIRCYVDSKDLSSAELIISDLLSDEEFPPELNQSFALSYAHYNIQKLDYYAATEELESALELTSDKQSKTRYLFILAQLHHRLKNYPKATYYYEQVLKKSPDYEMAFNAKINRARAFDVSSGDTDQVKEQLKKMLKDGKNKEYLDVIYFGLAELSVREQKINEAIPLYRLSVAKSVFNEAQKALSSLSLGRLYYEQQNYREAQAYYDTAVAYIGESHEAFRPAKNKQNTLTGLIQNLDVIAAQDSLQRIALMPESERIAFVDRLIAEVMQAEQIARELEASNRLDNMMFDDQQGSRGLNNRLNQGGQSKGGKWYFYNSTTLSFGYSEFTRKWGRRKQEDAWRRANKTSLSMDDFEGDTIQDEVFDPKNRESYLSELPLSAEQKQESNQMIIEAFYNAGAIYKEELDDYPRSMETFEELNKRFPKNENRVMVLYYLFRLHSLMDNNNKSELYKQQLLSDYPESEYAKIIGNDYYLEQALASKSEVEMLYEKAHQAYEQSSYKRVIQLCQEAKEKHPSNLLRPHFDFLEAMASGGVFGKENMVLRLKKVIEAHSGHERASAAKELLRFIEQTNITSDGLSESGTAESGGSSAYAFSDELPHYFLILFKDYDLELNAAKAIFSDYHSQYYSLDRLNISSILMDKETHMISVREFENAKESLAYYKAFLNSESSAPFGGEFTAFIIAAPNFPVFFKNRDIAGYKREFEKYYLKQD